MMTLLRARGIDRAFVDVSGDVAARGAPPGESGWLVGIADPDRSGAHRGTVRQRGAALGTAANTVSVVRDGAPGRGARHEPRDGVAGHGVTPATVVTRTAVAADALSTAMLVSGRSRRGVLQRWAV